MQKVKLTIGVLFLILSQILSAQTSNESKTGTKVIYYSYNDQDTIPGSKFSINYANGVCYLSKYGSTIYEYIDFNKNICVSIIKFEDKLFKSTANFDSLPKAELSDKHETILGYKCKLAKFFYFSNTIEVWYTDKANIKGSPYRNFIPDINSVVLKVIVNGGQKIMATSIEDIKNKFVFEYPADDALEISDPEFEELKIKSRYTTIMVFDDEIINFDNSIQSPALDDDINDNVYHFSKGSVIIKKLKLPGIMNEGVEVFAKLKCRSNGDAYDRTGTVFLIPTTGKKMTILTALEYGLEELPVYNDNKGNEYQGIICESNYDPPVELMRFFTSFGVGNFNEQRVINNYTWEETAEYKQDITSLIPDHEEEIWIGVFVGNYDNGGHKVSLELDFYPADSDDSHDVNWIQPLFNTVNIMEMSGQNYGRLFGNDTLKVSFEITEDIENLQLIYTTTGHGGWGGGDEFNPKLNQIFLDGEEVFKIVPWRSDCATYRLFNPASGNFSNGMSSSDYSRSNWCPATLTPPYLIPLSNIEKGWHTIEVVIDQGEDEGNSFSHWNISGIIVGTINPD